MLTARRITIAVILGITFVFALAGWRLFTGESEKVTNARASAPVPVVKALASAPAANEAPTALNQVELAQQLLVDDLQVMERRFARQDAEIKRLKAELDALSQKYDALASIAATAAKEARPEPVAQPPKKKKKRVVKRPPSKKKGAKT